MLTFSPLSWLRVGGWFILALALGGCQPGFKPSFTSQDPLRVQGAGATFPAPLYRRWLEEFARHRAYQNINNMQRKWAMCLCLQIYKSRFLPPSIAPNPSLTGGTVTCNTPPKWHLPYILGGNSRGQSVSIISSGKSEIFSHYLDSMEKDLISTASVVT